jgi:hypothetical protein
VRRLFFLGVRNACLDGVGEATAEQGASLLEGDFFAGIQDGAVGGGLGDLAYLGDKSDGLFQGESFRVIAVFDGQDWHRNPSRKTQITQTTVLPIRQSKIERVTQEFLTKKYNEPTTIENRGQVATPYV